MTRSTSSKEETTNDKSPSSHSDSIRRTSISNITVLNENNVDYLNDATPKPAITLPNTEVTSSSPNGTSIDVPVFNEVLPSVVHNKVEDFNEKHVKIYQEQDIKSISKALTNGEGLERPNSGFDFENDVGETPLRKISCCYGFGVFLILFLGLGALTSLVTFAGFYQNQKKEGNMIVSLIEIDYL